MCKTTIFHVRRGILTGLAYAYFFPLYAQGGFYAHEIEVVARKSGCLLSAVLSTRDIEFMYQSVGVRNREVVHFVAHSYVCLWYDKFAAEEVVDCVLIGYVGG